MHVNYLQSTSNTESKPGTSSVEQTTGLGDQQTSENSLVTTSGPMTSDSISQSRVIIPPRIQNSSLASSILLRRPQSPLNTGRTQLLIHKQTSVPGPDSTSPKSPLSPGQYSCKDENQAPDKRAVRNKLRSTSFRLKDLLDNRPFIRSQDGNTDEAGNENSQKNMKVNTDSTSTKVEKCENEVKESSNKVGEVGTARTRWRREGMSSLTRSRSSASERTATLVSARYLRTKTRNSVQPSSDNTEQSTDSEAGNTADKTDTTSINSKPETGDSNSTSRSRTNLAEASHQTDEGISKLDEALEGKHETGVIDSSPKSVVIVGATLLRSPRTRTSSGSSNVPSSPVEQSVSQNSSENKRNVQNVGDDITHQDKNGDLSRKTKAITDLERVSEVNLVFDSENIGQTVSTAVECDKEKETTHSNREYRRSQSEYTGSQQQVEASHKLHRNYSEPTSPEKEYCSIRGSSSYDNTPNAALSQSSPALKRSLAVTDLDKAMIDRDHQKLKSMFRENNKEEGEVNSRMPSTEGKTEGKLHFVFELT